jgi:hypothetical protein
VAEGKALTRRRMKLVEAGAAIRERPTENPDYQHTVLTSVYLPLRNPGDQAVWEKQIGSHYLRIESGAVLDAVKGAYVNPGLPYGARARLVMIYLTSQAVKTNNPQIEVGGAMVHFLRRLGLGEDGRVYREVRDQLRRLSVATIRLAHAVDGRTRQVNASIVEGLDLWSSPDASQRALWQDTVTLSEPFFRSVREHAVPLDDKAVGALSNNPGALDAYSWLAARLWRVRGEEHVSWEALHEQFGYGTESSARTFGRR